MSKEYIVQVHKKVSKFIEKQQPKIKKAFTNWITDVKKNPHKANDGRMINFKLDECKNCPTYKKRFGSIRVIYTVNDGNLLVLVIKAGNRGQVYKS